MLGGVFIRPESSYRRVWCGESVRVGLSKFGMTGGSLLHLLIKYNPLLILLNMMLGCALWLMKIPSGGIRHWCIVFSERKKQILYVVCLFVLDSRVIEWCGQDLERRISVWEVLTILLNLWWKVLHAAALLRNIVPNSGGRSGVWRDLEFQRHFSGRLVLISYLLKEICTEEV